MVSVGLSFPIGKFMEILYKIKDLKERYENIPLKQIALLENLSLVYEYIDPVEFGDVPALYGFADENEPGDFIILDPTIEEEAKERMEFFKALARIHMHREGVELKGTYQSGSVTMTFDEMKKMLRDGSKET